MFLYYWMLKESEAKRRNEAGISAIIERQPKSVDSSSAILDSIFTIPSSSKFVFCKRSEGVKMEACQESGAYIYHCYRRWFFFHG
jgi:hypothetical protein